MCVGLMWLTLAVGIDNGETAFRSVPVDTGDGVPSELELDDLEGD